MHYLDYAAATPVDDRVFAAMQPFFTDQFYNPSATYGPARSVARSLQSARAGIAHWLGARPSEILFTAGGTEANNLAIHGILHRYSNANIVVSSIEHEAVLNPANQYNCRKAAVDSFGVVRLESVRDQIDHDTVLLSIMYANNEIGTIQPIREIAQLVMEVRQERRLHGNDLPLYFHTDACQAAAYLDLHVARLGVDLMTINGGKIYGPKQSGVLFVKSGINLKPLILGGGQERGLRSGTENIASCVGLGAAVELVQTRRHTEVRRLQALQAQCISELERTMPAVTFNGSRRKRLPNNLHLTIPGADNERLLVELERHGILAASGSACSASTDEPSHVLKAIGLSNNDARASLRFTMGISTNAETINLLVAALNIVAIK